MVAFVLVGCIFAVRIIDNDNEIESYGFTAISQEDAARMMEIQDNHVVVDVRGFKEYDKGHISAPI